MPELTASITAAGPGSKPARLGALQVCHFAVPHEWIGEPERYDGPSTLGPRRAFSGLTSDRYPHAVADGSRVRGQRRLRSQTDVGRRGVTVSCCSGRPQFLMPLQIGRAGLQIGFRTQPRAFG
jgi:hypothetical protein